MPIVLLRIADVEDVDIVRELLQAHEYWRMKQLAVDLVILNDRQSSYIQELQIAIETLARANPSSPLPRTDHRPGRVFLLRADLIGAETRTLLASVARVALVAQRGRLFEQLERILEPAPRERVTPKGAVPWPAAPGRALAPDLEFFNGLGGFARNGREYVTVLGPGQSTPAPWINVIANPAFGFQTGTEGGGYTWSVNSRENQITPWSNDPVSDPPGEAFYLRDDDTGDLWTPTALPIRDPAATYVARHGRGYTRFQHVAHEIGSELLQFVPVDDPIKISRLVLSNRSSRARRISVTAYVDGMAMATLPLVVERGVLFRPFAAKLALRRLRFLYDLPQGPEPDASGYKGFFYHFLDIETGRRVWQCELSTIDSAFLFAGMLTAAAYFDQRHGRRGRRPPPGRRALSPGRLELGAERRRDAHARLAAGKRLPPVPLGGLRRGAAAVRAGPGLADVPAASGELRRLLRDVRVEATLRPRAALLRAAVHPPALAPVDRLPRPPRRLHARPRQRLLREQPAGDVRAAGVRDPQPDAIRAATGSTAGGSRPATAPAG